MMLVLASLQRWGDKFALSLSLYIFYLAIIAFVSLVCPELRRSSFVSLLLLLLLDSRMNIPSPSPDLLASPPRSPPRSFVQLQ